MQSPRLFDDENLHTPASNLFGKNMNALISTFKTSLGPAETAEIAEEDDLPDIPELSNRSPSPKPHTLNTDLSPAGQTRHSPITPRPGTDLLLQAPYISQEQMKNPMIDYIVGSFLNQMNASVAPESYPPVSFWNTLENFSVDQRQQFGHKQFNSLEANWSPGAATVHSRNLSLEKNPQGPMSADMTAYAAYPAPAFWPYMAQPMVPLNYVDATSIASMNSGQVNETKEEKAYPCTFCNLSFGRSHGIFIL